ncbi:hypothetical protein FB562_0900 [Homoserinimonas aerilata]|uniref:Tic20 family protein n=1 Tax=Homoserinimonas aerilata TaxID=1162970 RepID=A0A542YIA8_9MICO|nr:DUF4870 domain-containing protein [Homoserinimonas aerilata]TQL47829.1 hypothetical protein FB562_0900 [Homoserinimonas aerilata]
MTDQTPPPASPAAAAPLTPAEDNQWASFAHLGGILWILPPLIIWLVFKDRGTHTDREGKESVNFQIAVTIGHIAIQIINAVLTAVTFGFWMLIGWILPLALWILTIVFCIQGFNAAKNGQSYRYPVNLRLIK